MLSPTKSQSKRNHKTDQATPTAAVGSGRRIAGTIPTAAKRFDLDELRTDSIYVNLAQIERHPKNRVPHPDAVERLAASIDEVGQLDDVLLRPHPSGAADRYQMIAGETRWLAAKRLGKANVRAQVRAMTDAEALAILAESNAAREDLTPIDRAKLLADLTAPEAEGGAGMTQEEAGRIYNLSRSGVANAIRLLKLPAKVRDAVASGRVPETFAREVLALFDGPLAERAEKAFLDVAGRAEDVGDAFTRDGFVNQVVNLATNGLQWVSRKRGSWVTKDAYYATEAARGAPHAHQCFDLTDELLVELKVAEVPGRDGLVAFDGEAYKRRNVEAAKALLAKFARKQGKAEAKETKAIVAAPPEDRAKLAAERLASALHKLALDFRGAVAAQAVAEDPRLAGLAAVWFVSRAGLATNDRTEDVAGELLGKRGRASATELAKATTVENWPAHLVALLGATLFEPGGEKHRYPGVTPVAEAILLAGEVDLSAAWFDDCEGPQYHVRRWLDAHDTETLANVLARHKVSAGAKAKKAELVEVALGRAAAGTFPIPKGYALKRKGAATQ